MHDAGGVRFRDRLHGFEDVADGFRDGQRAAPEQLLLEVVALEQLHHHVRRALLERTHVDDAADVLALHARGSPTLAAKTRRRLTLLEDVRVQELERDRLIELEVPGPDDEAHAAGTEQTIDAVPPADDVS